jgi:ATP-dependent Lon protease
MIAIRGRVVFPSTFINFDVGRKMSVSAVENSKNYGGRVFISSQKDPDDSDPKKAEVYTTGVVCKIRQVVKSNTSDTLKLSVEALYRAKIVSFIDNENYLKVNVVRADYIDPDDEVVLEAASRTAKDAFTEYASLNKSISKDMISTLTSMDGGNFFIDNALSVLPIKEEVKQTVLEEDFTLERLEKFAVLMGNELEIGKVQKKIDALVRKNIDAGQKEYYLREQLKAIHTELGDSEEEKQNYANDIKSKNLDKQSEEKLLKEIARLDKINPSSPDYSIILNYLDWIKDLPLNTFTKDNDDLNKAKAILDADHFGLEKVKERIVEYLAVLQLTKKIKGPILCFVGPPGVGKTSIATSIARAMDRKFVRMSLGGVKDEAEIRGHRRTYVGAMPGRIIYGLKQAGSMNPVFLLDEIDKLSSDIHGDPASALLEVLDPEQNSTFRDRFMEIPIDLSKVMFITTANSLDGIPAPLLDRMEVISLSGYTELEKLEIAERYLVPKARVACGLTDKEVSITRDALTEIITGYTMEAGVRNLEREVSSVVRKIATGFALKDYTDCQVVDKQRVNDLLGKKRHLDDLSLDKDEVGVCTGLAWTSVGGTTLAIEVGLMKGKGEIILTGKLGDVMKESARAGISYIRANADKFGISEEVFENKDIHVHVPEGATPKDGPSAGITMATAILSAFSGRAVKKDVAMTGELTLRGKVLAIGGLKEKVLAAHRIGIKTVIVPKANEKDIDDIPKEVAKNIKFITVESADEVFKHALKD